MPTYVFKGRNRLNEIVVGERVADNREALRQILRREQVTLTSVKEKGREIGIPRYAADCSLSTTRSSLGTPKTRSNSPLVRKLPHRDIDSEVTDSAPTRPVIGGSFSPSSNAL